MKTRHFTGVAGLVLLASITQGAVVINEIQYDQAGTDAGEYVELYNNGGGGRYQQLAGITHQRCKR